MADTYKIKNITVRQKIATGDDTYIVCGNSDYTVHWDLDEEWAEYAEKTMLVVLDSGEAYSIQFTGTEAALPALPNTRRCVIGLMAGDVRTTTGAMFVCRPSIRDASGVPVEPPADVYAQLVSQLAGKISEPSQDGTAGQALITDGEGGRSWGTVQGGGAADAVQYTEQVLTDEQQAQARANIMAGVRLFYSSDEVIATGVALDDSYGFKDVAVFPRDLIPNSEGRTEGNGRYKIVKNSSEITLSLSESADGVGLKASAHSTRFPKASAEVVSCTKLFPGCWKATIKVLLGGSQTDDETYILGAQLFANGASYIPLPLLPDQMAYAVMENVNSIPDNARALHMTNGRDGYVDSEITIVQSDSGLRDAMVSERRVVALNYSAKKADLLFVNNTYNPSGSYLITSGIAIKDGKIGTFSITTNYSSASYLSVNVDIPESGAAPLIVTITETTADGNTTYSADHTFDEINAVMQAGRNVYAVYQSIVLPLMFLNEAAVAFGVTDQTGTHEIIIMSDDFVEITEAEIHGLPDATAENAGKYLKVVGSDDDGYSWSAEDAPGSSSDTSLGVTGATVGQIAKITAVDANGKPTAWQPVDMPTGGGSGQKPLSLIAAYDFKDGTERRWEETGLDNLTELIFLPTNVTNATETQSGLTLLINDIEVAARLVPSKKQGANTAEQGEPWEICRYNGIFWEFLVCNVKSGGAGTTQIGGPSTTNDEAKRNVGPATKISLYVPNSTYKPVTGTLEIWGR